MSDYVSWTSLTDQKWSARHLPATRIPDLPAIDRVLEMFRQPGGRQRLSRKSTCLFPAFAQYLTDGFIRTRMPNISLGETDDLRRQNTSNHQRIGNFKRVVRPAGLENRVTVFRIM